MIELFGQFVKPDPAIESPIITTKAVELRVQKLFVISAAAPILPFQLEDASRPEPTAEELAAIEKAAAAAASGDNKSDKKDAKSKDKEVIHVGQNVRLDNRVIDLRVCTFLPPSSCSSDVILTNPTVFLCDAVQTPANHAIFKLQSAVCQYYRQYFLRFVDSPLVAACEEGRL